ncbi:MAG: hypothetical protein E3J43_06205 [Candidatus Heimdallarchaeota archaeon]|nr:MAG: hypothetical protein E3J43_06205 [Candidatus Heimdallarchaeota archaeon]
MPNKGDLFSQEYNIRFGSLTVSRGKEDNLYLYAWEAIPDCTDKLCPLDKRCSFTRRDGKCQVIAGIVKGALTSILSNYGPKLNNAVRNRIGTHLMPLYSDLARMLVYETSLTSVHFVDQLGNPRINPVYKEKREVARTIETMWKQLGLADMPVGEEEIGNYYEQMEKANQEEMKRNDKPKLKKRK